MSNRDTTVAMLAVLAMPVLIALMVIMTLPLALFYAWAAQKMYGWFLLPLHAPRLNLWHIYGITLLIGLFSSSQYDRDKKLSSFVPQLLGKFIGTFFVLLIGYLIKGHIHV